MCLKKGVEMNKDQILDLGKELSYSFGQDSMSLTNERLLDFAKYIENVTLEKAALFCDSTYTNDLTHCAATLRGMKS
jgi:hypothetical protein